MEYIRCHNCRRALSVEDPVCPDCGASNPVGLTPEENWMSERDPLRLDQNHADAFRFLFVAALLFILVAVLLAVCASVVPPRTQGGNATSRGLASQGKGAVSQDEMRFSEKDEP